MLFMYLYGDINKTFVFQLYLQEINVGQNCKNGLMEEYENSYFPAHAETVPCAII